MLFCFWQFVPVHALNLTLCWVRCHLLNWFCLRLGSNVCHVRLGSDVCHVVLQSGNKVMFILASINVWNVPLFYGIDNHYLRVYMQDTGKVASPRALGSAFSRWIPVRWRYASIRAGIAFSLVFNGLCSLYHILRMLWQRSLPWWQVQLICFLQQSLFVAHYNTTEVNSLSAIEILMTPLGAMNFEKCLHCH